jgi:sugar fermentation stimulation protein A
MRWQRGEPRPWPGLQFEEPLVRGRLRRRYMRFMVEVELPDGQVVVGHCPNTGSMLGLQRPGSQVCLSRAAPGSQRRLRYTLEMVRVGRTWVGVNTMRPVPLVARGILGGKIRPLAGYDELRTEVPYGVEGSRIDVQLERRRAGQRERCLVEVKNVTLAQDGWALFPDAVTSRGARHLRELARVVRSGQRGVMLYLVQRTDCTRWAPAREIDPHYARTLRRVARQGVEVLAYRARVTPRGITFDGKLPVQF